METTVSHFNVTLNEAGVVYEGKLLIHGVE